MSGPISIEISEQELAISDDHGETAGKILAALFPNSLHIHSDWDHERYVFICEIVKSLVKGLYKFPEQTLDLNIHFLNLSKLAAELARLETLGPRVPF